MENIRLALQGIWSHKLRSFLTMLGIIIGIASIITIVSTITGTNEQIKENLIGSGSNVVSVQLYRSNYVYDMGYSPLPDGVKVITEETRQSLEELDGVEQVSLYLNRTGNYGEAYHQGIQFSGSIYGVDQHYFSVMDYQVTRGRGFLPTDYSDYRKVVLIDNKAAASLFGDENPVGQVMEIRNETFTVIGVVNRMVSFTPNIQSIEDYYLYADTSGGSLFIPDSAWPVIYRFDEPQSVAVRAENTDAMTAAGRNVAEALTKSQIVQTDTDTEPSNGMVPEEGMNPSTGGEQTVSEYSYRSEDLLEQAQQLQEMSEAANQQLLWIAAISLLVGGIGVMNIMLVSVTERTAEIGLKKALGAKRRRILTQFLAEASVLTFLGGVVGVGAGIALAQIISRLNHIPVAISIPAIVVAVAFSVLMGLIFGLLPAMKAARLNPIEALRRH